MSRDGWGAVALWETDDSVFVRFFFFFPTRADGKVPNRETNIRNLRVFARVLATNNLTRPEFQYCKSPNIPQFFHKSLSVQTNPSVETRIHLIAVVERRSAIKPSMKTRCAALFYAPTRS